jgi:hypothetical protein
VIVRTGSGWQYILADLSLILFMVTAAALAATDDAPAHTASTPQPVARIRAVGTRPLSPQAEPLALYRSAPGAPPLGQWLRQQSADARQQLTIVAQYVPGAQAEALRQAAALAQDAGEAGVRARIIVEPGQGGTSASLAFDVPEAAMARDLQEAGRNH